jgi:hypothetical protein
MTPAYRTTPQPTAESLTPAVKDLLVGALERRLPGYRIRGTDTGLDLLLELPHGSDAMASLPFL